MNKLDKDEIMNQLVDKYQCESIIGYIDKLNNNEKSVLIPVLANERMKDKFIKIMEKKGYETHTYLGGKSYRQCVNVATHQQLIQCVQWIDEVEIFNKFYKNNV